MRKRQEPKDKAAPEKTKTAVARAEEASNELLDYLFGTAPGEGGAVVEEASAPVEGGSGEGGEFTPYVIWVDVELCDDNPYQPRNVMAKQPLDKLIASINENGQIQAATARPHPTRQGRFQLGVGHRRKNAVLRGANAGIKQRDPHLFIGKLRVEVSSKDDEQMLNEAYAENEDREPLSIFDRAAYYVMLRELESRRIRGLGLTPVSSPTARKRAGAAVTADGLISWEELVAIRRDEGKPLPGARTLRRIVDVLAIPEPLRDRLALINLADPDDKTFEGITEKHCSALLLLKDARQQSDLIDQIEAERLSANETTERAKARRDGTRSKGDKAASGDRPNDSPSTSSAKDGTETSSSASPKAPDKAKKQGKQKGQDLIQAFLSPATQGVAEAARLWSELRVGEPYRAKMLEALDELDAKSIELRHALEVSKSKTKQ